jgi:hypothetical protein
LADRLVRPDRASADPAERHDPRSAASWAETWKRQRVAALDQRRHREQLGRGHHALPVWAVDSHLKRRGVVHFLILLALLRASSERERGGTGQ